MAEIQQRADTIFAEIGTFIAKEIAEGILRQVEGLLEKQETKKLPKCHEFVSLLSLPKYTFLEYERKIHAGLKPTSPKKQPSKTPQSSSKSDPKEEHKSQTPSEEDEKIDITGEIVLPKKRGNKSRIPDIWGYAEADKIIRADEGYLIYYRNDVTQIQKCMNPDSTVIIKSLITNRLKALSTKQIPDIYDLQIHVHDSIVKVDNDGKTLLEEFLANSFPNNVQRLTLFASLSKTKTEPLNESLISTMQRIISS
jgi:hypothetical protein